MKEILMELIRIKLSTLQEKFEPTIDYFEDVIEMLVDKDFLLSESLTQMINYSRFAVNKDDFLHVIKTVEKELAGFTKI